MTKSRRYTLPKDFDHKLHNAYHHFCISCEDCLAFEQDLKKTAKDSEEYQKLLERADNAYVDMLQRYHFLISHGSIAISDIKIRLNELGLER